MRLHVVLAIALASCQEAPDGTDPSANADGDCMTDAEEVAAGTSPTTPDSDDDDLDDCDEIALGTDPLEADSDDDGFDDIEEIDCFSDPTDDDVVCSECGWKYMDPGDLESTGNDDGDVPEDIELETYCGDEASLWDAYGEYHILFVTAAW